MAYQLLILAAGLVLLVSGGELLVRGASAVARRLGVSPLVVGLTVVSMGTSAPELAVSLSAAFSDSGDIAFGNVIGSNICNVALLLGLTALITPLAVASEIVSREVPMMILASATVVVLSLDTTFGPVSDDVLSRGDGLVLLLLFAVFVYYTATGALRRDGRDPMLAQVQSAAGGAASPGSDPGSGLGSSPGSGLGSGPGSGAGSGPGSSPGSRERSGLRAVAMIGYGILALAAGGYLLVEAASSIARSLGVSEVVIGITVVAVGTSLPELVTSLVAARRGEADIAVGNIVGSNIFNLLLILSITASIRPVAVPRGSAVDLVVMLALALVLLPIVMKTRLITRLEGGLLVLSYAGFTAWQLVRS